MIIRAHAKINWSLDITGSRPDGFHLDAHAVPEFAGKRVQRIRGIGKTALFGADRNVVHVDHAEEGTVVFRRHRVGFLVSVRQNERRFDPELCLPRGQNLRRAQNALQRGYPAGFQDVRGDALRGFTRRVERLLIRDRRQQIDSCAGRGQRVRLVSIVFL